MDGGDRAGYKQISKSVNAILLTATSSKSSGDWYGFEVISTGAQISSVIAPGLTNADLIDSGTTYALGAWFGCSQITMIKLSTGTLGGAKTASKVIAYNRILL